MSLRDGRGRPLWPFLAGLTAALALFELTGIDLWIQDRLYDPATGRWLVDARDPIGRALFYTGPKAVIIALAATLLVPLLGRARWRARWRFSRRELGIALLVLATGPALIGLGKKHTNVFCPSEIFRYGGDVPYVKLCSPYPPGAEPARRGHCFPAGHASGGFALLGFAWLRRTRAWFRSWLLASQLAGWTMGLYQMLKGAHYLSHTIVTMIVSALVVLLWQRFLPSAAPDANVTTPVPAS